MCTHTAVMIKSAQQIARDRRRREVEQTERITIAAGDGDYETVLEMLETGTDPECQDPGEYSPLSEASSQGHIEIVKLLLDFEADPNSVGHSVGLGCCQIGGLGAFGDWGCSSWAVWNVEQLNRVVFP